ncbi:MAG: hypothetical protein HZC47_05660 [Methanobacterium sp.]|uniref:hypothetical protein n=1 Tax=Methanobacterium sp. TaxID=2164 RepID=UPI003D65AD30|nr:hypothetical protein [Methanobacterium sp.]
MGISKIYKTSQKLIKETQTEFNDTDELNETIKGLLNLKDSEIYEKVYEATKLESKEVEQQETLDNLLKVPQYQHATKILKKPLLYFPPITDLIEAGHFLGIINMIDLIAYAYKQNTLTSEDLKKNYALLERLMSSLNNFDTVKDYDVPDEEFYQELRQMKWDKKGKRLFGKLEDVRGKIMVDRGWGSASSTFQTGEMFMLGFLAACNAVNHERNVMLTEDVIMAYKTYFKLLNTDISKLELY